MSNPKQQVFEKVIKLIMQHVEIVYPQLLIHVSAPNFEGPKGSFFRVPSASPPLRVKIPKPSPPI